ncbi:MAG: CehA/McbA family metallohydrolase [Anaerolineae bacterium]
MSYSLRIGERRFYGLRGNLHMHTPLSDGTKGHRELGAIASEAGLDFIVITDHNVYRKGLDGWVGDTLVLVGEEVHDPDRQPQSSHTLCFDIQEDVAAHSADPDALIDAVAAQGGFTFLAHPFERDVAEFLPEPNISWRDWGVQGFAGIELWNYMSEFKSALKSQAQAVLYAYAPDLAIVGPYPETLRKWDELLMERRTAALGGSDAHGTVYHIGPLSRAVQPYEHLFRCINTHLLSEEPLRGDLEHDRAVIYDALRMGRGFLGYERPGKIDGFSFWAQSGGNEATMGESLPFEGTVELRVSVPERARLRLLRNGQVIAQTVESRLTAISHVPGVYRVEAYQRHAGRERGWIFSNPIYVE